MPFIFTMNPPVVRLSLLGYQEGPGVRLALYNITASEHPALVVGSTVTLRTVAAAGARPELERPRPRTEPWAGPAEPPVAR